MPIGKGDRITLRTKDAIYAFCDVVYITAQKLQVRYCKRVDMDKGSQKPVPVFATDVVDRTDIVCMKQLL